VAKISPAPNQGKATMPGSSTYTWKNEGWALDHHNCRECGQPVRLKDGVFISSTRRFVRHNACRPTVVGFVSCGCEACELALAAIRDAKAAHAA
jgi:hypothetical protein